MIQTFRPPPTPSREALKGSQEPLTFGFAHTPLLRQYQRMISLSDHQLRIVMDAAAAIMPERRDTFLQRCGAMLKLRGRFNDADVADVAKLALTGLAHQSAA